MMIFGTKDGVTDYSVYNRDITYGGQWAVVGYRMYFDGVAGVRRVAHDPAFLLNSALTVMGWTRPILDPSGAGRFADKSDNTSFDNGWTWRKNGSHRFAIDGGGQVATGSFEFNEWQHVTFTAVSGGNLISYYNGDQKNTVACPSLAGITSVGDLIIGGYNDNNRIMEHNFRDFQIWNEALSPGYIANYYDMNYKYF